MGLPETTIALNEGRYEIIGTQDAVAQQAAIENVRSVLPFQKENGMALGEVEKLTSSSRTTLQMALSWLEAGGFIAKSGTGKRGNPYRYFQVAAETPGA